MNHLVISSLLRAELGIAYKETMIIMRTSPSFQVVRLLVLVEPVELILEFASVRQ